MKARSFNLTPFLSPLPVSPPPYPELEDRPTGSRITILNGGVNETGIPDVNRSPFDKENRVLTQA
ncbi:MAG: hypothetical protein A2Y69_10135 [Candidatus Aminicenantes bacterium RBG_13_59_9]|nr:MAG: hypothetical protein A2Y69_10135 [Candidatus Aminicenantes bacterium RBG_13_59_9]